MTPIKVILEHRICPTHGYRASAGPCTLCSGEITPMYCALKGAGLPTEKEPEPLDPMTESKDAKFA